METESIISVQTYKPEFGHGAPDVPVNLKVGQGIALTLPLEGKKEADVYIERVQEKDGSFKWQVNISPDAQDIDICISVTGKGGLFVER